jgi:putative transposase
VAFSHDEEQVRAERARTVGLFRYSLVREAADAKLTTRQRGRLVRALAEREHEGPFGKPVRVSRASIDRWIRAWRRGGFDALVPAARQVSPRTPAEVLELAVALKKEVPERTAAQITTILRAHSGWSPDERTLQRTFVRLELARRPNGLPPQAFGRFEADAPNQRWTGDALHGPTVNGRKAILFAFIDDHSRMFTGYRWARREDTVRLEAALRTGIAARGIPASIYVVVLDTSPVPSIPAATCGNDTPRRSLMFQVEQRIVRRNLRFAGGEKVCGERWSASPGPGGSAGAFGCAA